MSSTNSYRSLSTCAKFLAFVEYMRFCEAQFLQVAVGSSVSRQSAEWVLAQLQAMARVSTHGGYDPTMTTDPFIVSKALHHSSRLRESEPCCDFIHSCRHAPLTAAAHVPQVIFEWWWITSRGRTSFYLRIPAELRPRSYSECDAPAEAEEPGVLGLAFAGLNGPRMHDSDSRDILGNSLRGRVSRRLTRWSAASRLSGNWATAGA